MTQDGLNLTLHLPASANYRRATLLVLYPQRTVGRPWTDCGSVAVPGAYGKGSQGADNVLADSRVEVRVSFDDFTTTHTDFPPEVVAYCCRHGILQHLETAVSLAETAFPSLARVDVRLGQDPDDDGEWVVVHVTVPGSADDFLAAYDNCIDKWVRSIPPEGLSRIRLSYHLV